MKSIQSIKVSNMRSRSGNEVPNQFTIRTKDGVYFQSYNSVIAFIRFKDDKVFLDKNKWNYSRTTGLYRNDFLDEGVADTRKKIESGEYKLTDLNK